MPTAPIPTQWSMPNRTASSVPRGWPSGSLIAPLVEAAELEQGHDDADEHDPAADEHEDEAEAEAWRHLTV